MIPHISSSSGIHGLPDEMLSAILKLLLDISDEDFASTVDKSPFKGNRADVDVLRVNKRWLRVASPLLYGVVVVRNLVQARKLANTLSSVPILGHHIRKLRLERIYDVEMACILLLARKITDLWLPLHSDKRCYSPAFYTALTVINPRRVICRRICSLTRVLKSFLNLETPSGRERVSEGDIEGFPAFPCWEAFWNLQTSTSHPPLFSDFSVPFASDSILGITAPSLIIHANPYIEIYDASIEGGLLSISEDMDDEIDERTALANDGYHEMLKSLSFCIQKQWKSLTTFDMTTCYDESLVSALSTAPCLKTVVVDSIVLEQQRGHDVLVEISESPSLESIQFGINKSITAFKRKQFKRLIQTDERFQSLFLHDTPFFSQPEICKSVSCKDS